jgi:hypothetical protein
MEGNMKALRGWVGFVLVLMVLTWAAGACLAQEPVLLEYKFTPGQTITSRVSISGDGAMTMTPAPPQMPAISMNLQANLDIVQRIASIDSNGIAKINITMPRGAALVKAAGQSIHASLANGDIAVTVNGEKQEIPPVDLSKAPLIKVPLQISMDKQGKVVDFKLPDIPGLKEALGNIDIAQILKSSSQGEFPAQPIEIGKSWDSVIKSEIPGMSEPIVAKTTYTLASVDTVGDQQVARITFTMNSNATNLKLTPSAKIPAGVAQAASSVTIDEMTQNVSGTTWFSLTTGQPTKVEMTMAIKEAMSMDAPQGGPQKMTITMAMKMTMAPK